MENQTAVLGDGGRYAATTMNWSQIKRELQKKDKTELVGYLKRLFSLNAENRSFLESNLSDSDGVPSAYYQREITESVNPGYDSPIDLKRGRKAIASFKKAAPEDVWGRVQLMMHFIEQGASFTLQYGDIDGRFYDSMIRMMNSILDLSKQLSSAEYSHLTKRFENLDSQTADKIGWGFSDHISDITAELQTGSQ